MVRLLLGAALGLLSGCGSPLLQCRLDAVSRLPLAAVEDPDRLTLGDARELARGLKACAAAPATSAAQDGGP